MNGLMVVDDEEGVRRSLKKVLEKDGYRIILAENGEEALDIVRSDGRDIETVISDYRMPGMDGLETLIEIGRMNAEITRIMLTGYATMASAIEAVNAGIDGFLTKPFENDELRAKVREYNIKKRLKQFVSEQVLAELQKKREAILPKRMHGERPVQRHPRIFRPFRTAQSRRTLRTPQPPLLLPPRQHHLPPQRDAGQAYRGQHHGDLRGAGRRRR